LPDRSQHEKPNKSSKYQPSPSNGDYSDPFLTYAFEREISGWTLSFASGEKGADNEMAPDEKLSTLRLTCLTMEPNVE
jgi:hypothetical protein